MTSGYWCFWLGLNHSHATRSAFSLTIGWIDMKLCTNVHVLLKLTLTFSFYTTARLWTLVEAPCFQLWVFTWSSSPHRCCSRSARPLVLCSLWSAPGWAAGRRTGSPVTARLGNSNTLVSCESLLQHVYCKQRVIQIWVDRSKSWSNTWSSSVIQVP